LERMKLFVRMIVVKDNMRTFMAIVAAIKRFREERAEGTSTRLSFEIAWDGLKKRLFCP
jgi:hypothetical protein